MVTHLPGMSNNLRRQSRQPTDLCSVAFSCPTGNNLAQENDLVVPLTHGDVAIADAAAFLSEFRQLVIMSRKEGARLNLVVQKFGHAPGDGKPVKSRCSATNLVENDQAPFGGIVYDV